MKKSLMLFHVGWATVSATAFAGSLATVDISVQIFGVPISVILAAFAGSASALAFLPPMSSRAKMLSVVAVGTLAAAYAVRLIAVKWLGWTEEFFAPVAFFIGLLAHTGLTYAFANLPAFLAKKFGGGS